MVLHGYRRPGTGETHGRCPGVGEPPYEFSIDVLRAYFDGLLRHERTLVDLIAEIDEGRRTREIVRYSSVSIQRPPIVTRPGDATWSDELRRERAGLASQLSALEFEIRQQRRRIEAWPGPRELTLMTESERAEREARETAARDPEKTAARLAAATARERERAEKAITAPDGSRLVVHGDPIRTKVAARNALSGAVKDLLRYGPEHRSNFPEKIRMLSEALAAAGIDPSPIVERATKSAEASRRRLGYIR